MNDMSRRVVTATGIVVGAFLVFVILGSAALAMLQPAPDFAPFTMQITQWDAEGATTPDGRVIPVTMVRRLDYTNVRNWQTTLVTHSVDPRYEGSTHRVSDDASSSFDALTRQLAARFLSRDEAREVPSQWLIPGLIDALVARGFARTDNVAAGTVTFRQLSQIPTSTASSRRPSVSETVAVYDLDTRLPLSVKISNDGQLSESIEFVVLSRP